MENYVNIGLYSIVRNRYKSDNLTLLEKKIKHEFNNKFVTKKIWLEHTLTLTRATTYLLLRVTTSFIIHICVAAGTNFK